MPTEVQRSDFKVGVSNGPVANPGNIGFVYSGSYYESPPLVMGIVLRSGGGTYDVEVAILPSMQPIMCTVAAATAAQFVGISECVLPVEGTKVVVMLPVDKSKSGLIIASYPSANRGVISDQHHVVNSMIDLEGKTSVATEAAWQNPAADKDYLLTIDASAGRPLDVVPGNRAWVNEQGLGVSILNLLLLLKATDKAQLQLGILDDAVKLISGYFQHLSAQGTEQIYNDGGFITRETGVSVYQWEHSGFIDLGTKAFKENTDTSLKTSAQSGYDFEGGVPEPRKRMQCYTGFLGDIMNMFVASPDVDVKKDTVPAETREHGLMHTHIDASGRLTVRSASGVSFQRADRIPVPKRVKQAWDPSGNKMESKKGKLPGSKKPYGFPNQGSRSMLMRDALAYRDAQAYAKIHNQSQAAAGASAGAADHDFYLPEERDMQAPPDEYDKNVKGSEKFQDNADKRSYFNLEEDGSIIIRDAWGSEIIMRGGNIIISCAGQIELRPGKSLVALAGSDVVLKGRKSVDITATNNDVRIKANTNMHLMSEGRGGHGGGILLESKSRHENPQFSGVTGEQVQSTGIVLKAATSRVLSNSKTVHLAAQNVLIDGADINGKPSGTVAIGGIKYFQCAASNYTSISVGEGAGLSIGPRLAVLAGATAVLSAGSRAAILEGKQAWVPYARGDMKANFYTAVQGRFQDVKAQLLDSVDWLGAFPPVVRADITFTYRSPSEYGTDIATEIEGSASETFSVYQSAWARMAQEHSPFVPVQIAKWKDYGVADTFPWPGAAAYDASSQAYTVVESEPNILDKALGVADIRENVLKGEGKPGTTKAVSFNEYEVVQIT